MLLYHSYHCGRLINDLHFTYTVSDVLRAPDGYY
jgi:hypothetical protein